MTSGLGIGLLLWLVAGCTFWLIREHINDLTRGEDK